MQSCRPMLIGIGVAASAVFTPLQQSAAQASTRGQPTTAFAVADFARLRWLEGSWAGTVAGGRSIFERCHVVNDSTIEITYYADSAFAHETSRGRLYLSVGHIYHTMGPDRWGATHVDDEGAYFVPQTNAPNSLSWSRQSNDQWTATLRAGFVGRDRVMVYHMRRAGP